MIPRVLQHDDPDVELALLEALETGQTVIFPTETVYGIGGNPWDEKVLTRVRDLKGRSPDQPFTLHVASLESIESYADLSAENRRIAASILPGPYTLLLPAREAAPPSATLSGTVGIRLPDHPFFSDLVCRLNRPIFGTSVNVSGEPPLSDIGDIIEQFSSVDLIISGPVQGTPSSILDLTVSPPNAVRGTLPEGLGDR